MTALSPGVAQSCFELLSLVSRQALSFSQLKSSFDHIGVTSTAIVIENAQNLKWLRANEEGFTVLTPAGARLMAIGSHEMRLRQAILDYIENEEPFWLQNALFGRKKLLSFAGTAIAQLFLEAGLVNGTSSDVVAFWDALSARARGQRDDRLLAIGREGERLTLDYEENRTGKVPKWISIDNNEDGYDILSVVSRDDSSFLSIEVKTTKIGLLGEFFLTYNEWNRARTSPNHVFHLWDISMKSPKLLILMPNDIVPHIPANQGGGEWTIATIPFDCFNWPA